MVMRYLGSTANVVASSLGLVALVLCVVFDAGWPTFPIVIGVYGGERRHRLDPAAAAPGRGALRGPAAARRTLTAITPTPGGTYVYVGSRP